MGLPTSEELQKQELMKKFMAEVILYSLVDFSPLGLIFTLSVALMIFCLCFGHFLQHPEMDFSRAKIS